MGPGRNKSLKALLKTPTEKRWRAVDRGEAGVLCGIDLAAIAVQVLWLFRGKDQSWRVSTTSKQNMGASASKRDVDEEDKTFYADRETPITVSCRFGMAYMSDSVYGSSSLLPSLTASLIYPRTATMLPTANASLLWTNTLNLASQLN